MLVIVLVILNSVGANVAEGIMVAVLGAVIVLGAVKVGEAVLVIVFVIFNSVGANVAEGIMVAVLFSVIMLGAVEVE